jgi:hypothetical protein
MANEEKEAEVRGATLDHAATPGARTLTPPPRFAAGEGKAVGHLMCSLFAE